MKPTLRAAAAVAALALAVPALAAEPQSTHPRVGLGLSFNPSLLAELSTTTGVFAPSPKLYVPIYLTPEIRLEPEIGWLSVTNDTDSTNNHAFDLGIGALYVKPVSQAASIYGGIRLASVWLQNETRISPTVVQRTNQRNTILTFAFGTEYQPAIWFSVGVEAQLGFVFLGDEEINTAGTVTTGSGGSATTLQGLFFLRAYFL